MTLLISIFAAVIATVIWYVNENARKIKSGLLCFLFWGASIMWFVDAVTEYLELKAAYFTPELSDIINDTFLGMSVVALALMIWIVYVLVKDPLGTIKNRNN